MRIRALLFAGLLVALSLVAAPANAANQISGTANFAGTDENFPACDPPPDGFADFTSYDPIRMKGSLDGCWYTKILNFEQKPSGVYLESGEEVFVGSLNGGPQGIFTTTYKFEAKLTLDASPSEIRGRCQHKIVAGSGTGGFAGASGRVDFKDIIDRTTLDLIRYDYRGHISLA
jgi:hypothetical protein